MNTMILAIILGGGMLLAKIGLTMTRMYMLTIALFAIFLAVSLYISINPAIIAPD